MTVEYRIDATSQAIVEDFGYLPDANFGDLGSTMFSHGGTSYSVSEVYRAKISSADGNTVLGDGLSITVSPALPDGTIYQVGSRTFTVGTDSPTATAGQEQWDIQDNPLSWTAGQHVTVSLKLLDPGITVSPTTLTVTEEETTGETYTVVLDSQPTAAVTVTVAGHAGTDVTPTPASLTFTTSNWDDAQTVTVTAGDDADTTTDTVTLTHSAASTDSDYDGITIASVAVNVDDDDTTAGICDRTEEVRNALVALIPGVSDCAAVTTTHLAAITGTLNLSGRSITSLKTGDFDGLTKLTTLALYSNELTSLPEDVFDGLTELTTLNLYNNDLSSLPEEVFDGLTKLTSLFLHENDLN